MAKKKRQRVRTTPLIKLRQMFLLPREDVARYLRVSITTVQRWELHYMEPNFINRENLRQMYMALAKRRGWADKRWDDTEAEYFKFSNERNPAFEQEAADVGSTSAGNRR